MKKLAATLCVIGTAFTLGACDTMGAGNVETAPPYSSERTAGYEDAPVVVEREQPRRAERVFRQKQTK